MYDFIEQFLAVGWCCECINALVSNFSAVFITLARKKITESPWRNCRWLFSLLHLQLGLLWLFTPVQLLLFQGIALTSFMANVLVVPIYSVILIPLILLAVITQGHFPFGLLQILLRNMSRCF